jgi:hypothetical protein
MAWGEWYETDTDSCQHMRKDGMNYEMIQAIWLDRTEEDAANGLHEYVVVKDEVELTDDMDEEIIIAISPYSYSIPSLIRDYGDGANDVIAECILEESSVRDSCAIGDFDSLEDARRFVKEYCEQHKIEEEA